MLAQAWSQHVGRGLMGLLFPPACAACGGAIRGEEGQLCEKCALDLQRCHGGDYCQTCGEDRGAHLLLDGRCTQCRLGKPALRFEHFVRVGRYDGALKSLVLHFKTRFTLDRLLGEYLADAIQGRIDPTIVDVWVPIPAHWRRRLSMGFQPTALLAAAAARRWSGKVVPALVATKYVRALHRRPGMAAAERAEAVRGVFCAARWANVKGKRVGLIDDVTNTGATLREAKRALKLAGASPVVAAVLARVSRQPVAMAGVDPPGHKA